MAVLLADRIDPGAVTDQLSDLDPTVGVTVVEYAADHDADLIVLGRTGQSGLSEVLLGSTTDRVLRRADAPVLTVGTDAVLD